MSPEHKPYTRAVQKVALDVLLTKEAMRKKRLAYIIVERFDSLF
jgi:hypothetical protein